MQTPHGEAILLNMMEKTVADKFSQQNMWYLLVKNQIKIYSGSGGALNFTSLLLLFMLFPSLHRLPDQRVVCKTGAVNEIAKSTRLKCRFDKHQGMP